VDDQEGSGPGRGGVRRAEHGGGDLERIVPHRWHGRGPLLDEDRLAIAYSFVTDLLVRAADVTLKEGRKLVLVPRETPLHLGHLRNMVRAAEIGAVILPPVPAFYHAPKTIDDLINQTVGKVLDQFNVPHTLFRRWTGAPEGQARRRRSRKG
jgi:hypothetical protein